MILRLTRPIAAPPILNALVRAIRSCGFEGDARAAALFLIQGCRDPHLGLWFGLGDAGICGSIAVLLPTNPMSWRPEIMSIANWGPPGVARELVSAAVAFVRAAGYNSIVALNRSGHSDAVFTRHFRGFGSAERLGTVWQFNDKKTAESGGLAEGGFQ